MNRKFDLIVWDWDGTLADSTQIIVDSIRRASEEAGLDVPDQHAASGIIGLGLYEAIHHLFGALESTQLQQVVGRYKYHYAAREDDIPLFEGAMDTINFLRQQGCQLAVATGKGRNGLNRAITFNDLERHFDATRCVDECHSKPHPQMLLELMDELQVVPERTLMIGDTSFDMQMAQNANVARVAVSYGAHPVERLLPHEPLAHFDHFAGLSHWLRMNLHE